MIRTYILDRRRIAADWEREEMYLGTSSQQNSLFFSSHFFSSCRLFFAAMHWKSSLLSLNSRLHFQNHWNDCTEQPLLSNHSLSFFIYHQQLSKKCPKRLISLFPVGIARRQRSSPKLPRFFFLCSTPSLHTSMSGFSLHWVASNSYLPPRTPHGRATYPDFQPKAYTGGF